MTKILVLYYSKNGHIEEMAKIIARGVNEVQGCEAVLRTVPTVSADTVASLDSVPDQGPPYASETDLIDCDGLLLGSPSHFGNMCTPLKHFLDSSSNIWFSGQLSGKPGAVFVSTASMHGGHESTLLSMMLPLLHHGMFIVGLPPTEKGIQDTKTGGTPYGAGHVENGDHFRGLDETEKQLALALGKRVAKTALKLKS